MRLDDDSFFLCNVSKDPFSSMRQKKAKYGWIVEFFESPAISGETLWNATKKVIVNFPCSQMKVYERKQHSKQFHIGGSKSIWRLHSLSLLEQFRSCWYGVLSPESIHGLFWLLRQAGLQLEVNWKNKGGFYYYRWGDALVRTLGVHLFLKKEEVQRLDIPYQHQKVCNIPKGCVPDGSFECEMKCIDGKCNGCRYWDKITFGIERIVNSFY